jgi:predicted phage terminase large subunit-like protein
MLEDIRKERAERSLHEFVKQAWHIVVPGANFKDGWHIKAICDALQDVRDGKNRRLMCCVPPRHSKSTICSIMFPVWMMIHRPTVQIINGSYSAELATETVMAARRLIQSPWFQKRWGDVVVLSADNSQKTAFSLTSGGGLRIASTGAGVTGKNADILIGDDLLNSNQAYSAAEKASARQWYNHGFNTRLNDRATGAIIIIGQRLAEDDIPGMLLEREGAEWRMLCFPGRFEANHPNRCKEDIRTEEGELLWPEHFPEKLLLELETPLGDIGKAGQIQQRPMVVDGNMFKLGYFERRWFRDPDGIHITFTDGKKIRMETIQRFLSVDFAMKVKTTNDFTVISEFGVTKDKDLLWLDCDRFKTDSPNIITKLETRWKMGGLAYMVCEETANGELIIKLMQRQGAIVKAVKPILDKVSRAVPTTVLAGSGRIILPRDAHWNAIVMHELLSFPTPGVHDDTVDTLTQAGDELNNRLSSSTTVLKVNLGGARTVLPGMR